MRENKKEREKRREKMRDGREKDRIWQRREQ